MDQPSKRSRVEREASPPTSARKLAAPESRARPPGANAAPRSVPSAPLPVPCSRRDGSSVADDCAADFRPPKAPALALTPAEALAPKPNALASALRLAPAGSAAKAAAARKFTLPGTASVAEPEKRRLSCPFAAASARAARGFPASLATCAGLAADEADGLPPPPGGGAPVG